ncbi:MAG: hypothetical protein ACOY4R_13035 [Pseudomonadota bacterium]
MHASILAPTVWAMVALGTFIATVGASNPLAGGRALPERHVLDHMDTAPDDDRPHSHLRLDPFGRPTCRTPLGIERRIVRIGEPCL